MNHKSACPWFCIRTLSLVMTFLQKAKRFFEPLKESRLLVLLSVLKFSTWALYGLFSVYMIRESVRLFSLSDLHWLTILLYEFITFSIGYLCITWISRKTDWPYLYYAIVKWIYQQYLQKLFLIDGNYIERMGTGKLIAIITSWEKAWVEWLTNFIKEGTRMIILTSFIFYIFLQVQILYGVIFLIVLIVLHIVVVIADQYAHRYRRMRTEKKNEFTRQLVRIIMSRNEIIQWSRANEELTKNASLVDEIWMTNIGINNALFFVFNSVRVLTISFRIILFLLIIFTGIRTSMNPADLAGILALFVVFENFLLDSVEFYKNFSKEFSDIEKIWEIIDTAPVMRWYSTWSPFTPENKNIEIEQVTYGYTESKVFSDFSLTIEKGKKTALVWVSGGGKTTLIKLIAGYLHPESGSISVLGNPLDSTALKTYYPHIGYLTQDPSVFDGTIRENLISAVSSVPVMSTESSVPVTTTRHLAQKWREKKQDFSLPLKQVQGSLEMTDTQGLEQKLTQALKLAHCDFVFELEKGLDTEIGERGVRLSWWQKQRLAIAKIFLKDPEIILLDEPTSALDSFSEEKITEALGNLFEWRTVIIVAHRLQTVKKADDIIVIEWGSVVERWTHTTLVEQGGIYARMLELQSGF